MPVSDRQATRREALNIRIKPQMRELIDRAAQLSGKNRTDFVLDAARRAAEDTLLDRPFLPSAVVGEGCPARVATRAGVSTKLLDKKTVTKLVVDAGQRCEALLDAKIQNVPVSDVQADEVWGFVGRKEGHKRRYVPGRRLVFYRDRAAFQAGALL